MAEGDYSPGLRGVIAGETAISDVREGVWYRGYKVDELAEQATFEEVAYLLLHEELPDAEQLKSFQKRLRKQQHVPHDFMDFMRKIPDQAPLMDVMQTCASVLAHWDPDVDDNSHEANVRKAERLLVQMPVILAARHRLLQSMEPVPPDKHLSLAGNLVWMLLRTKPSPRMERAMDMSLMLYAEHEFNASTFTARVVCSTMSDLHSAISAAIGALKGPLHGGANQLVMQELRAAHEAPDAKSWVRQALAKPRRVMGFGHRVYKEGDPRAAFLKNYCRKVAEEYGDTSLEETAERVEEVMAEEKGLRPNLDWATARLYYYLGLAEHMYTPIFVVSRVAGWCAHAIEQHDTNKLIRPRARYIGPERREFISLDQRGEKPEKAKKDEEE